MSKFDKNITPGSIITAYHSGYHRVTRVERRFYSQRELDTYKSLRDKGYKAGDEYNSAIFYKKILNSKLKEVNGKKELCCDACYCKTVSSDGIKQEYEKEVQKLEEKYEKLLKLV